MATYKINSYESIDFSELKDTNVFDTFNLLLFHGFALNTAIANNLSNTSINTSYLSKTWTQSFTGNASNGTQTIASTDGAYVIQYVGSNIGQNANGVYKSISYTLPNEDGNTVKVTLTGSITRFTSGDTGSGTITKMTYEFGDLKVELYGSITKNFNESTGGNTYTGSVTGFNFEDSNGQLSITDISPAIDLASFDNLTFDQLAADATSQDAATTRTTFADLFTELDKDIYKSGTDTVIVDSSTGGTAGAVGSSTNPFQISSNIENLPLPEGSVDYYAYGNALNNVMTGNAARNFFKGLGGNDSLIGNAGNDTLEGGEGLDTLNGGEGNDTLDGGSSKDTLTGGNGDDTYVLDLTSSNGKFEDKVVEAKNAGSDTLSYRSSFGILSKAITLKLSKNFENLDISQTGNTNFNLTGDAANNTLTGNAGTNVIDGGKGADTMIGGAGNDTYVVDNAGDIVTEASDAGSDQINIKLAAGSYTLGSNVENGVLLSAKTFTLNGNELDNTLTNKKGTVTLNGGEGADTLNGGSGRDTLNGGIGNDTMTGGKGNDTMNGGAGNDAMTGGAGADTFVWTLADAGSVGTPAVDSIADFSVKQKDVLDLRDLLPSNAVESDVAGLLANFIDVRIEGANTVIGISTDGTLGSGENQQIVLANVNLFTLTSTADETALLNNLMSKNQLLID